MKSLSIFLCAFQLASFAHAFVQPSASRPIPRDHPSSPIISRHSAVAVFSNRNSVDHDATTNNLFKEFKTSTGEVIDPYEILNVSRTASRQEIKQAYYDLSRKYHPDGARHGSILPGRCNSMQDVEYQWERIKLSNEILSSKRLRCRYDRCEFFSDPGAVVQRAAANAVSNGLRQVGASIWNFGSFTVQHIVQDSIAVANQVVEKAKKDIELKSLKDKSLTNEGTQWSTSLESSLQPMEHLVNKVASGFATHSESSRQNDFLAKGVSRDFANAQSPEFPLLAQEHFNSSEKVARSVASNKPGLPLPKVNFVEGLARGFATNLGSPLQKHVQFFKPSARRNQPKTHSWDPQVVP